MPSEVGPIEILDQHRMVDPTPPTQLNRAIPRDLETICLKTLQKTLGTDTNLLPGFGRRSGSILAGISSARQENSHWQRLIAWRRRNRNLAFALGALAATWVLATLVSITLWQRSARHARESEQFSAALQSSQKRIRDSVTRFQGSIFSSESLHWQMTPEFRNQMFQDMMNYLDEFSNAETDSPNKINCSLEPRS